jgi:hypothetical protein
MTVVETVHICCEEGVKKALEDGTERSVRIAAAAVAADRRLLFLESVSM